MVKHYNIVMAPSLLFLKSKEGENLKLYNSNKSHKNRELWELNSQYMFSFLFSILLFEDNLSMQSSDK